MKKELGPLGAVVSGIWQKIRERIKSLLSPSPQERKNASGDSFPLSALWKGNNDLVPVPVPKKTGQGRSRTPGRAPWSVLLFAVVIPSTTLYAAKPEITGLLPAGAQVGQTVEVEVLGKLGTAPVKIWCDQEGITGEATKDGKKLTLTIAPETAPGLCWLRVWNNEGSSALRPFLVGRLPEVDEKEPNETISNAQAVEAAGCVVNGRLSKSGELDTFKVSLKKGQTLIADVLANQVLGSPMDAVLQVASAKGFLLAQADDSPNFDPRLAVTAPEDGEYFVRVFAFPSQPNSSIRYSGGADYIYRLTLTTGPYVRHTLPLSVAPGKEAALSLKGWNIPEDKKTVNLPAETENLVPHIPFPAAMPLSLQAVDHPTLLETAADKPKSYTPPFSITGTIAEADEIDRYPVSAKKGETLTVRIESAAIGFPLDPVLEIQDASGKSLTVSDDKSRGAADAEYSWKVPADGEYQILVSDRFQHGDWDYAYRLTVESPKPAVKLSVAADVFALTKEKPLEIPVSVAESNGFDEEIKLEVAGLPEGFTVETAEGKPSEKSEEGGRRRRGRGRSQSSETINVKITAKTDEPFHGPIWIKAKAGEKTHSASTPTANASTKAQHVWISYQPKK